MGGGLVQGRAEPHAPRHKPPRHTPLATREPVATGMRARARACARARAGAWGWSKVIQARPEARPLKNMPCTSTACRAPDTAPHARGTGPRPPHVAARN